MSKTIGYRIKTQKAKSPHERPPNPGCQGCGVDVKWHTGRWNTFCRACSLKRAKNVWR